MEHLGDITKISGFTAPIVDCIIGGSPCQDLSVAGKRAGLDGERSGLFMEQVRILKGWYCGFEIHHTSSARHEEELAKDRCARRQTEDLALGEIRRV